VHLLVSEQYIDSIMHGATIKVTTYINLNCTIFPRTAPATVPAMTAPWPFSTCI